MSQRPQRAAEPALDPEETPVQWIGPSTLSQAERDAIRVIARHAARVYYEEQVARMKEREAHD